MTNTTRTAASSAENATNVTDAKKPETWQRRIRRTEEEMHEGKRRPCCWPGCKHRERTGR